MENFLPQGDPNPDYCPSLPGHGQKRTPLADVYNSWRSAGVQEKYKKICKLENQAEKSQISIFDHTYELNPLIGKMGKLPSPIDNKKETNKSEI